MLLIVTQKGFCDRPDRQIEFVHAPADRAAALVAFKVIAFDALMGYRLSWYITNENVRGYDSKGEWALSVFFDNVEKVRVVPSHDKADRYHIKSYEGTYLLVDATLEAVTSFADLFNGGNQMEAIKLRHKPETYNKPE